MSSAPWLSTATHTHYIIFFFAICLGGFFDCTDATDELTGSVPVAKAGMPHPM